MHGFALNVDPDLAMFGHIVPCGIRDRGVTSIARILGRPADMRTVVDAVVARFAEEFVVDGGEVDRQDVVWHERPSDLSAFTLQAASNRRSSPGDTAENERRNEVGDDRAGAGSNRRSSTADAAEDARQNGGGAGPERAGAGSNRRSSTGDTAENERQNGPSPRPAQLAFMYRGYGGKRTPESGRRPGRLNWRSSSGIGAEKERRFGGARRERGGGAPGPARPESS
jgi:hypothetical protein